MFQHVVVSPIQLVLDYTNMNSFKKEKAEVLFETIAPVLTNSIGASISLNSNFYEIGGNSLNTIYIISKLYQKGYYISNLPISLTVLFILACLF